MERVAIVTGGAVRVGRALTLGLAEAGYAVVLNYRSSEGAARELAKELEGAGHAFALAPADISEEAGARSVVRVAEEAFGRIDLVVNNASIFGEGDLMTLPVEEWDRVMAVNVRGPFLVSRAASGLLAAAEGSVVNIVDLSAFQPWVRYPHHSVSKAALLQLTRVLARVLAPEVRVNAIAPGTVLPPAVYDEASHERDLRRTALGRIGAPEDVLRTVLFLAESPFVTGEVVVVDGGRILDA